MYERIRKTIKKKRKKWIGHQRKNKAQSTKIFEVKQKEITERDKKT